MNKLESLSRTIRRWNIKCSRTHIARERIVSKYFMNKNWTMICHLLSISLSVSLSFFFICFLPLSPYSISLFNVTTSVFVYWFKALLTRRVEKRLQLEMRLISVIIYGISDDWCHQSVCCKCNLYWQTNDWFHKFTK